MEQPLDRRLDGIQLLADLPQAELRRLEQSCAWHVCSAGARLFERNDASRDVYLVVRGCIRIVNHAVTGRAIAYSTQEAGSYFGELAAVDGEPRAASAIAIERSVVALMMAETFNELLLKYPPLMRKVMSRLARIIRISDERIMDLSTLGAMQRINVELLRLAKPDPLQANSWIIHPMPAAKLIAVRAAKSSWEGILTASNILS